jgi:AcrR family transcriptional regulator
MQRRLLDATIKLLVSRGYSRLRTADVARVAKVSRGARLHHFRTKDALVLAALEELYRSSTAASEKRLADAGPVPSVRHALEDSAAYYYADEFLAILDVVMSGGMDRALAKKIRAIAYRYRQPLEEKWTRRLAQRGVPLAVARDAIWLLQSVIRGLRVRTLVPHDPRQTKRVTRLALELTEEFLYRNASKR